MYGRTRLPPSSTCVIPERVCSLTTRVTVTTTISSPQAGRNLNLVRHLVSNRKLLMHESVVNIALSSEFSLMLTACGRVFSGGLSRYTNNGRTMFISTVRPIIECISFFGEKSDITASPGNDEYDGPLSMLNILAFDWLMSRWENKQVCSKVRGTPLCSPIMVECSPVDCLLKDVQVRMDIAFWDCQMVIKTKWLIYVVVNSVRLEWRHDQAPVTVPFDGYPILSFSAQSDKLESNGSNNLLGE